jgi:uncharacterized protein
MRPITRRMGRPVLACSLLAAIVVAMAASYPVLEFYVTDSVGVLTSDETLEIEIFCENVYQEKGAEIAILVVDTTAPDGIDLFALRTFEENGLGQKGEDNGLLILISVAESAWRVEVGYGLEGALPDALVGRIVEEHLVPHLQQGDYFSGLLYATTFLGMEILDNYDGVPPPQRNPKYPLPWVPLTFWQLMLVVAISVSVGTITKGKVVPWVGGFVQGKGGRRRGGGRSGGGGARGRW